jgi:hypothetical protein
MLAKIIDMIDREEWLVMGADVKGDIYEKLLEQNAQDVKSSAGQYFTPRPLIRAMVECIQPQPMKTIADPACGTGGFFLAAYDYLIANNKLDKDQNKFLKLQTFSGNEIVAGTRRLALMNLFLHNIGDIDSEKFISPADALIAAFRRCQLRVSVMSGKLATSQRGKRYRCQDVANCIFADHPLLFMIRENNSGSILFMERINNNQVK